MTRHLFPLGLLLLCLLSVVRVSSAADEGPSLRPPAVPLVTHDPYFSCWSFNDHLYDDWPKHWTGKVHGMCGLVRVDGKVYRWMGGKNAEAAPGTATQTLLEVGPTTTHYVFDCGPVSLSATFVSPVFADD